MEFSSRRSDRTLLLLISLFVFSVYAITAHRTITWWFGSSYPLAAVTRGIHFSPGSLLLTILGWLVTRLPLGVSKAFLLNLFSGMMAAFTCYVIAASTLRLIQRSRSKKVYGWNSDSSIVAAVGVGLGCLYFAFSEAVWRYAIVFMPYTLTVVFTALILWSVVIWWQQDDIQKSDRWLFVILLLFGLDVSVHRTNALLLPGFLIWILVCRPKVFTQVKSWIAGAAGLCCGLAFHLLIIPMAARNPIFNANDPSNWSRFYYYVSLEQYGGSWLMNMWPRQAPFFSVQVADYFRVFKENFLAGRKILAIPALVFFHIGMVVLLRRNCKLAIGLLILFIFSSLGAVLYFNLPAGFFSPMDRHYLPSFVLFGIFFACGTASVLLWTWKLSGRYRAVAFTLLLLLVLSIPLMQLKRNFSKMDGSKRHFAYDYAMNILSTLQPDAILFIAGDHYPLLLYLQTVENARPDVTILCTNLMNTEWYVRQTVSRYPDLPLTLMENELESIEPKPWKETAVATEVDATHESLQLPANASVPDTFRLHVKPTLADRFVLAQDWLLIKVIEENRWRRPIYFNTPPEWLSRHARLEGLVSHLVPQEPAALSAEILRQNLFERYGYRGYNDASVPVDRYTRLIGHALYRAFHTLARYEYSRGETEACLQIKLRLNELIPIDRIDPSPELRREFEELCK